MTILIRSADFEVSGDGRTIEGRAFRWETPSSVTDDGRTRYLEEFDPRSADQTLKMKGLRPLFVRHEHIKGSVGETEFLPSSEGLMFRARTSDTTYAELTLARVHARELPAVSVGYRAIRTAKRADAGGIVHRRTEIALVELSLAEVGQHIDAEVLAVRAEQGTPRLDAMRRRRALLLL